jgi:hypothetical protein
VKPALPRVPARNPLFLFFSLLLLNGCHFQGHASASAVEFTQIPVADRGGPDKLSIISGRASSARPGQQMVIYAKSDGLWWIQPFADRPFTKIQDDQTWKASVHLGTEYAALVVDPDYTPPDTTEILPSPGPGVAAVATVAGTGGSPSSPTAPSKTVRFSGYDWVVRSAASFRGGSGNTFDADNVFTDDSGALHLRIAKNKNRTAPSQSIWTCAEVRLARNLGYGTYVFTVRDVSHMEPSAVLTLFTWDDLGTEQRRRELDVEISRWGDPQKENAQYVVQPYYIPNNVFRFSSPSGVVTHSFHWVPGEVSFSSASGEGTKTRVVGQHEFHTGIPTAGGDSVHLSFYLFGAGKVPLSNENEVVIDKFEYLP